MRRNGSAILCCYNLGVACALDDPMTKCNITTCRLRVKRKK